MSTPSSTLRLIAQAVPRSAHTKAPQLWTCSQQSKRLPQHSHRTGTPKQDLIYQARRSLFTASISKCAEAAAVPKPATTSPPLNRPPPKTTPAPQSATSAAQSATSARAGTASLASGLSDQPITLHEDDPLNIDWSSSFHGLSVEPFKKEAADILMKPLAPDDVEIKPDGIVYLPEIKYRRILNKAFGPGGWGLAPRGQSIVTPKAVTREYALLAHGRLVSVARGEQDYFSPDGIPTATEGCKSNAMMRCCKDLGVASELWDPRFIRKFKAEHCRDVFVEHAVSKKKSKIWIRKGDAVSYPFKETKFGS